MGYVGQVNPKPTTKKDLLLDFQVQWSDIHHMKVQKLIRPIRKRVSANGGSTHYWNILPQLSFAPVCLVEHGAIVIDQLLVLVTFYVGQDVICVIYVVCWLYVMLLTMPQWNKKYIPNCSIFDKFIFVI